ncbi:MAG: D-alanine--D-alanine ligase family protein, partial [Patescibacteria group bacterium]|nr:D-alanine--D-alanine ligase family protein [Patescibacteria group bacterium]
MPKLRIAVLFGGRSGEHEVSLVSASSVLEHLDAAKYEVLPIGITKEGKWIAGPESLKLLKSGGALPAASNALIKPEPFEAGHGEGELGNIDVVFPVLHGPYGEDGAVQGFLELTGIPYVGCGVLGSAVCMDKVMQKNVLKAEGFSQARYEWFWTSEWEARKKEFLEEFGHVFPLFVKPANLGSSVGISKAHNQSELSAAVQEAAKYDRKIIVEQGIIGAREIEVAVLGNQKPRASVAGEIFPSNEFYDYDAKYVDNASASEIPAKLSKKDAKAIRDIALRAYRALDCEGMARVDFLLGEDGVAYINEVNTIPGFTSISMYPKLWEASGVNYAELLDELIRLA